MPSKSRYQGRGFNPVSPLPFAQAKERRVEGKQARRDMLKQREKQEKERDKELGEQQKRLEQIAIGYGMTKGQAASMSRGELAGVVEAEAERVTRRKDKLAMAAMRQERLAEKKEREDLAELEARLRKEITAADEVATIGPGLLNAAPGAAAGMVGGAAAKADTFLHDMVREGVPLTSSLIQQVALKEIEHERKMELRKGAFGGQGWSISPLDPAKKGKPWEPGTMGVFASPNAQGGTSSHVVYGDRQGSGTGPPPPWLKPLNEGKMKPGYQVMNGTLLNFLDTDGDGFADHAERVTSPGVIPANLLDPRDIRDINEKIKSIDEEIDKLSKKPNPNVYDRQRMAHLKDQQKFHQSRLTGARQVRAPQTPQQPVSQQQAPTRRPPNNLPGRADSTPQAPYWMEQNQGSGVWIPTIDPAIIMRASSADKNKWWKEMWRLGMFKRPGSTPAQDKDFAHQWALAVLQMSPNRPPGP